MWACFWVALMVKFNYNLVHLNVLPVLVSQKYFGRDYWSLACHSDHKVWKFFPVAFKLKFCNDKNHWLTYFFIFCTQFDNTSDHFVTMKITLQHHHNADNVIAVISTLSSFGSHFFFTLLPHFVENTKNIGENLHFASSFSFTNAYTYVPAITTIFAVTGAQIVGRMTKINCHIH